MEPKLQHFRPDTENDNWPVAIKPFAPPFKFVQVYLTNEAATTKSLVFIRAIEWYLGLIVIQLFLCKGL